MKKLGAHPGEAIEEAQGTSTYYGIEFVTVNDSGLVPPAPALPAVQLPCSIWPERHHEI